jgi:hypothetical protein
MRNTFTVEPPIRATTVDSQGCGNCSAVALRSVRLIAVAYHRTVSVDVLMLVGQRLKWRSPSPCSPFLHES